MATEFKKGDVVVLRSGGPPLTVTSVYTTRNWPWSEPQAWVQCEWFDGGEHDYESFVPEALVMERAIAS
jgi:uncharacterized protein YodC (DUF2158 family)